VYSPQGIKDRLAIARAWRRNDPLGERPDCSLFFNKDLCVSQKQALPPGEELGIVEISDPKKDPKGRRIVLYRLNYYIS
jgi:hypothetical protein